MSRTKTLDAVVERAAALPEAAQQELAEIMAEAIDDMEAQPGGVYRLSDDERRAIERGLAAAREGQFASDEEAAAVSTRRVPAADEGSLYRPCVAGV